MKLIKNVASVAAVLLMAGCAVTAVQPGMSRQDVIAQYGAPSRVVPLSAGTRLQYSTQPSGQSVVIVDLNAAGRVVEAREVMTLKELIKIEPGKWSREDVEREFGRPATVDRVASWSGDIMTYRWLDSDQPMYFWVYLDGRGMVQRTAQGMEFPFRMHEHD